MQSRKREIERPADEMYAGFLDQRRGRRLLPDIRTAILARMRGYVGGFYPSPLTGDAAELGYHPLSSATPEELAKIEEEAVALPR